MVRTKNTQAPDLQAVCDRLDRIIAVQSQPQRMAYRPAEVAEMINISLPLIYQEIRSGRLKAVKINNCYVVSKNAVEQWLSGEDVSMG